MLPVLSFHLTLTDVPLEQLSGELLRVRGDVHPRFFDHIVARPRDDVSAQTVVRTDVLDLALLIGLKGECDLDFFVVARHGNFLG